MLTALLTTGLNAAVALGASAGARAAAEKLGQQRRSRRIEEDFGAEPAPDHANQPAADQPAGPPVFQRPSDAGIAFFSLVLLAGTGAGLRAPLWTTGLALLTVALVAGTKRMVSSVWLAIPLFLAACSVAIRYSTWDARGVLVAQAALGPALTSGEASAIASAWLTLAACWVVAALWGAAVNVRSDSRLGNWGFAGLCAAPALAVAPLGGPGLLAVVGGPQESWPYAVVSVLLVGAVAAVSGAASAIYRRGVSPRWVTLIALLSSVAITLGWLV